MLWSLYLQVLLLGSHGIAQQGAGPRLLMSGQVAGSPQRGGHQRGAKHEVRVGVVGLAVGVRVSRNVCDGGYCCV